MRARRAPCGSGRRTRRRHPVVVVASEPMDEDPSWRALGSGELLHVDGQLATTVERVLEHPPAHRLTLADLDARAAASQQHPAASDRPRTHLMGQERARDGSRVSRRSRLVHRLGTTIAGRCGDSFGLRRRGRRAPRGCPSGGDRRPAALSRQRCGVGASAGVGRSTPASRSGVASGSRDGSPGPSPDGRRRDRGRRQIRATVPIGVVIAGVVIGGTVTGRDGDCRRGHARHGGARDADLGRGETVDVRRRGRRRHGTRTGRRGRHRRRPGRSRGATGRRGRGRAVFAGVAAGVAATAGVTAGVVLGFERGTFAGCAAWPEG